MGEVYLGRYRAGGTGLPEPLGDEIIVPVGPLTDLAGQWTGAGAAWRQIPALYEANRDRVDALADIDWPRASYLLRIAEDATESGIAPAELVPAYLRSKVAEPSA
jgi:tRNA A37 threonylcarbamoyladenosine modification protein TsaB